MSRKRSGCAWARAAALTLLSACAPSVDCGSTNFGECRLGDRECDGDTLRTCERGEGGKAVWRSTQCERCSSFPAECAEPYEPWRCEDRTAFCDGPYLVQCLGLSVNEVDCSADGSMLTCIELPDGSAMCETAPEGSPDAALDAALDASPAAAPDASPDAANCEDVDDGGDDDSGTECAGGR